MSSRIDIQYLEYQKITEHYVLYYERWIFNEHQILYVNLGLVYSAVLFRLSLFDCDDIQYAQYLVQYIIVWSSTSTIETLASIGSK